MSEILNEQQLFDLRQAFSAVDRDNDGLVSTKDIPVIFAHLDESYKSFLVEEDDLKRLIEKIDLDNSKQITFAQFLMMIAYKINVMDTEEELEEAFRMFDRTESGFITFDDLWHVMTRLGENLSKSEVKDMFAEANRNLDDKISFSEFIEMLRYS